MSPSLVLFYRDCLSAAVTFTFLADAGAVDRGAGYLAATGTGGGTVGPIETGGAVQTAVLALSKRETWLAVRGSPVGRGGVWRAAERGAQRHNA